MKLLKAEVRNFGSYRHLEFDFNDLGLALVHGATGSGKSTLQDIICWVLFGVTAKDGNADEVRSWTNPDEPTVATLTVLDERGQTIKIDRVRGKPYQNDLYWEVVSGDGTDYYHKINRGKDLTETQKLLEQRLGVSKDLYVAGAYYNEFSPTGAFFTAKAKDRRELFEKLADLELPKTIAERTSDVRKSTKKELDSTTRLLDSITGRLESLRSSHKGSIVRRDTWDVHHAGSISVLADKSKNFEVEKAEKVKKIDEKIARFERDIKLQQKDLNRSRESIVKTLVESPAELCKECGQTNKKVSLANSQLKEIDLRLQVLRTTHNPFLAAVDQAMILDNPYEEQLVSEQVKINPFDDQISKIGTEIDELGDKLSQLTAQRSELEQKISDLTQLNDLSFILRKTLLVRSVKEIEDMTNKYLERHFESELRVGFELEDSDDLNILITKNGYPGVYRQMSKGQRQLLRLCFSVSVMKATANRAGVHFDLLCFDEALDGMDADLKIKAFGLFQELELDHKSILVVEHSTEFKALFDKSYLVTIENDTSTIQEGL